MNLVALAVDPTDPLKPPKLRKSSARCLLCHVAVECPDDENLFVWGKSEPVLGFIAEHAHGHPGKFAAIELADIEPEP